MLSKACARRPHMLQYPYVHRPAHTRFSYRSRIRIAFLFNQSKTLLADATANRQNPS